MPNTQPTQPKEGEAAQIPVPKVSMIRAAMRNVAQPVKPDDARVSGQLHLSAAVREEVRPPLSATHSWQFPAVVPNGE
jgi:hypothetical protein